MFKKPELYPNSKAGKEPDVKNIVKNPADWIYSNKADGGRVQLFLKGVLGRSMKKIPSIHIQRMWKDINSILQIPDTICIEAEFYSPEMNFAEIMHFFRSEDVTSDRTRKKFEAEWTKTDGGTASYMKTVKGELVEQEWEFPGRDVDWLCTWHESLKFYAFNVMDTAELDLTKQVRSETLALAVAYYLDEMNGLPPDMVLIEQVEFDHVDRLYQAYDQAIAGGYEGLVVMRKDCKYKYGRHSATYKDTFKLKEDNLEFDGQILDVLEGTQVKEGVEKKINELGRSVTSKLQDDREPSGLCKGFLVQMEDGNKLTVSLKDFDHPQRRRLLLEYKEWIGLWIKFTGMAAVKEGGCPRHAIFTAGNVRDDK